MRTAAGLHGDQTRRQLAEERQHLLTSELPGDDDLALGIDAVDLEHLLCKVEPDGGNSCHGRPSLVIRLQRSLYGTSMPCEAPSTSSNARRGKRLQKECFETCPDDRRSGCGGRCFWPKSRSGNAADVLIRTGSVLIIANRRRRAASLFGRSAPAIVSASRSCAKTGCIGNHACS